MAQWAFSMESILGLNLPWRSLSSHLVHIDDDGNVDYMSSFQDVHIEKPVKEVSGINSSQKSGSIKTPFGYPLSILVLSEVRVGII